MKCLVSLGSPSTMDAGGGTGSFRIMTQPECTWDASPSVHWITDISPSSGQGEANVSFRALSNDGSSSREGTIVVNGEQARVSQRAPCRYDLAPVNHSIGFSGGFGSVTIQTSTECAWTAEIDVNWISFTSPPAGSGNGTVAFAVKLNDGAQRSGAITIGTQRSSVTQASSPPPPPPSPPPPSPSPTCTYVLSRTSDNVSWNEGAGEVSVQTTPTCAWTAVSRVGWMTIAAGGSRTGSGTVSYRFLTNLGPSRTGTLTIAGQTFTVIQGPLPGSQE